jgi:uncharacterized protein (TIGR03435 family)
MNRVIAIAILTVTAICAQSPPAFDVASVRVNNIPGRPRPTIQFSPDTLTMRQVSVGLMLGWAYGPGSLQILAPDWMQAPPLYDILAKASGPVPENHLRSMLQTLLAQRFHLAVHVEKKEMPVMALLVTRNGPKFPESDGTYDPARGAEMPLHFPGYGDDVHMQRSRDPDDRLRDSFSNTSMTFFATILAAMGSVTPFDNVPLPVIDMTGMPGRYDLQIVHGLYTSHPEGDGPQTAEEVFADLKPVLEKDLGLTLERRKAMLDVLVIDHADKTPTAN